MTDIRNIAIIAHVDHGKTTLVDEILKQVELFRDNEQVRECMLDSDDIERERGITILSKNISINYKDVKINIIDTPGHSDFGGQVERVLKLADGVILLVDAAEGPMPQTRFVLDKALNLNLQPIVLINKIDKPDARADVIHDKVFDLFIELDANDEQLDFPLLYASGKDGWANLELHEKRDSILPLLDAVLKYIPSPENKKGPVQMQIASLDYSEFVGRIGIGRVYRGELNLGTPICNIKPDGKIEKATIKQLFTFEGLERKETDHVSCGDLCAIVGIEGIDISDTIADAENPKILPPISLDEPTISMLFRVNDSPLYGQEGTYVSSRHIRARLFKETEKDTALHVEEIDGDSFEVSGRGLLHLSILIENMRREGYELSVSKPHVIFRDNEGVKEEPIETLTIDSPRDSIGKIIELVGQRKGEMMNLEHAGERQIVDFNIPTRGIIGLRSKVMTASAGEAIVSHRFDHYAPYKGEVPHRINGVLISMGQGAAIPYAINALQNRGTFFIDPNVMTYEGMIVAENCKEGDLTVNIQKAKQLSNVRASGSDKAIKIVPATKLSLEEALEYIGEDELVEVTPQNIRIRKRYLKEKERKKHKMKKS
ncbi:MAG: translational GTPase TypA [Verrucomicrobiota bacterium]|nr:translational GTPase TypA [Verrucomicrobiota bacterium]